MSEPTPDGSPPPMAAPPPMPAPPPMASPPPMAAPPPPPVAEASGVRAMLHSTEQTRTYPCASCGGELRFDIVLQKLKCHDCGTVSDVAVDATQVVAERDLRTALAALQSGTIDRASAQAGAEKEIVCQSCGGHTTFVGSVTAERCPYCATPIQRDDVHEAPKRLNVDGVVPFQIDERKATAAIEQWINSRWFAPTEFKTYNRTGSFSSVYMAYFTYDADTQTHYTGRRGDDHTRTVGSGDNQRTETYTTWRPVSGEVANNFDDIPVFANEGFDRKRISDLEPWPTATAKPYSPEYVAGHLCRTYDLDVEDCLGEATGKMETVIDQTIRHDIGGDHQDINSKQTDWRTMTYKHLLLPIWLLAVIYQERPFRVYINGVTGEVHGDRPWSKVKIIIAAVIAAVLIITLFVLYQKSKT